MSLRPETGRVRCGFTLVELLVVIGIIAILIAVLLPMLKKAQSSAQRVACLSNIRQLTLGYRQYVDDNKGFLPLGWPDANTDLVDVHGMRMRAGTFIPYLVGNGYSGTLNPPLSPNTVEERIKRGSIFKYVNVTKVYKCPGDTTARKSSYGINCYLHGEHGFGGTVFKISKVKRPTRTFVFIDEYDPRGGEYAYNLGSFAILPKPSNTWVDPPGTWHDSGACVSFLDGHCEYIKWSVVTTRYLTGNDINAPDPRDIRQLQEIRGGKPVD